MADSSAAIGGSAASRLAAEPGPGQKDLGRRVGGGRLAVREIEGRHGEGWRGARQRLLGRRIPAELRGQDARGETDPEGANDHGQQGARPRPVPRSAVHATFPTRRSHPTSNLRCLFGNAANNVLLAKKCQEKLSLGQN